MSGSNSSNDDAWDAGAGLWLQLFGELPPVRCDTRMLFEVLVANLGHVGPYCLEPSSSQPATCTDQSEDQPAFARANPTT